MTQDNEKVVGVGAEYAENTVEGARSALTMTSKNIQAIAGEMLEISKQSFNHATMEKLRKARGVDEIVAIQTNFVREVFEHATQITETYRDAWLRSMDTTVKATETASKTATGQYSTRRRGNPQSVRCFRTGEKRVIALPHQIL